jgi:two-component sensor histidine kinase
MSAQLADSPADEDSQFGPLEYARVVLNILEDSGVERTRLLDTQKAVLNMLDDFDQEKAHLLETQKAVLNILEDLAAEKQHLEAAQTEVLRSADAVKKSLFEKEILLKEVHHRVKNNLQVISSLLLLQARQIVDPKAREMLGESQNRVRSIALVHEKLYQSSDLAHIELGEYVESLADNLFQTYDAGARGISRVVDVRARMTIDAAIPCGLIINELITNSLKHAFPPGRTGTVRVIAGEVDGRLEITVEDDGVGLPENVNPRGGHSLGLDLVFTLARQIKLEVHIARKGGTTFRFNPGEGR